MIQSTELENVLASLDLSHEYCTKELHLRALFAATKGSNGRNILEIGSFEGNSAAIMILAAKKNITSITCVDLCDKIPAEERQEFLEEFAKQIGVKCLIENIKSSGADFLTAAQSKERLYDFIFHDGLHGQEAIPEYLLCWNLLRPNGVLAIHDFELISREQIISAAESDKRIGFRPAACLTKTDESGKEIAFFLKR